MASVRAALLLLPPVSVVVAMAARLLCRVTARKLSALARSQLACLPSGGTSFRYLVSSDEELPVALYCRPRSSTRRRSSSCVDAVVEKKNPVEHGEEEEQEECVFCLSCIEEGEEVRELRCRHLFHRACLDRWLRARPLATCPLCRGRLLLAEDDEEEEEESESDMLMLFVACVHSRSSWLWPS